MIMAYLYNCNVKLAVQVWSCGARVMLVIFIQSVTTASISCLVCSYPNAVFLGSALEFAAGSHILTMTSPWHNFYLQTGSMKCSWLKVTVCRHVARSMLYGGEQHPLAETADSTSVGSL